MNNTREEHKEIECIFTAKRRIELCEKQYFCETEKAYEIWDESELLRMVKRIPKNRVFWVWNYR